MVSAANASASFNSTCVEIFVFSKSKINYYFSPKCDAQAQDALEEIAAKVGVYYVSERILKLSSAEKSPKVYKKNMFFYMKNK